MENNYIKGFKYPDIITWSNYFDLNPDNAGGSALRDENGVLSSQQLHLIDFNRDAFVNAMYASYIKDGTARTLQDFVLEVKVPRRLVLIVSLFYLLHIGKGRLNVEVKHNGVQYFYTIVDDVAKTEPLYIGIQNGHLVLFSEKCRNGSEKRSYTGEIYMSHSNGDVFFLDRNFSVENKQDTQDQNHVSLCEILSSILMFHKLDVNGGFYDRVEVYQSNQITARLFAEDGFGQSTTIEYVDKISDDVQKVLISLGFIQPYGQGVYTQHDVELNDHYITVDVPNSDSKSDNERNDGPQDQSNKGSNSSGGTYTDYEDQLKKLKFAKIVDQSKDVVKDIQQSSFFSIALALADQLVETGNDVAQKKGVFKKIGRKIERKEDGSDVNESDDQNSDKGKDSDTSNMGSNSLIGRSLEVFFLKQ